MPAFEGGAALPVTTGGQGKTEARQAAVPVYVVSGGPVVGGRARRVVVVTSGPVEGGAARPVYDAGANALYSDEPAIPVYVVSGSLGGSAAPSSLLTGLIAYYKLDEASGTRVDSTGRGNDLTPTNAPGNTAGKIGNAVDLTAASSQYLSIADNADMSTGDIDFTIAGWFNLKSKSANRTLFSRFNNSGNQREYLIDYDSGDDRIRFQVSADGAATTTVVGTSAGSPSINTWYLVIAWHDATANTINIQIDNGTIDSASHSGGALNSTSNFQIGAREISGSENYADARIDEVGFWKKVFTSTERLSLWNGGTGLTYPFDDGPTLAFEDTFSGAVLDTNKWSTGSPFPDGGPSGITTVYQAGQVTVSGGECHLTSSNSLVGGKYPSGQIHTRTTFTFTYGRAEARIKCPVGQGYRCAFWTVTYPEDDFDEDPVYNLPEIDILEVQNDMQGPTQAYHYDDGGLHSLPHGSVEDCSQYHIYAVEWLSNRIRYYIDDAVVFEVTPSSPAIIANLPMWLVLNLQVGGNNPGAPDGTTPFPSSMLIDYVRVWAY